MSKGASFDDLSARLATAGVLAAVAAAEIWAGGTWFLVFAAVLTGFVMWEFLRLLSPHRALEVRLLGAASGALVIAIAGLPNWMVLIAALLPGFVAWLLGLGRTRDLTIGAALIMLAAVGMSKLRIDAGLIWMLWFIFVVIVTDIAGYFAGRLIGGPKIWPRVSPKKTWSGTSAGWLGAALVGWIFMAPLSYGGWLVLISILISMASQAGDMAESALKRQSGVKDSSSLLPGHGGVFDRFDGMIGAALLIFVLMLLTRFPLG